MKRYFGRCISAQDANDKANTEYLSPFYVIIREDSEAINYFKNSTGSR